MPFPTSLTAPQYTDLRNVRYNVSQFVAICPNTIVFQALVNQATFAPSFAQVLFDNVTVGAYTDIKQGMTVYIGTTDLQEATFVGRVRLVPTSTVLYINETSAALADNMTITVIDDRRLWDRAQRVDVATKVRFKDWSLTYQQIAPTIYNLQSSYVLVTTGVSASIALAPLAKTHVPSATISTWAWDVDDGTITVGNSSTQDITVSFPTGHRWVRLTVTDSGGRTNFIDVDLFCGDPRTASWSLQNAKDVDIRSDGTGYNATFTAWANVANVLDNTRVTIFNVERYSTSTTPIVANIDCVGYLRSESNNTSGDAIIAQRKEVSFTVEGFGAQLANLQLPGISALDKASPAIWGEINDPTPPRFVAYALIYHTTLTNLCSVQFGVNDDNYVFLDLSAEGTGALDSVNACYEQINGRANIAASGEFLFTRNANYLSASERNALTTVADVETQDILAFTIDREYGYTVGQILAGFGGYNTTSRVVRAYSAKAPAEASLGAQEGQQLNSQILIANQTDLQNRTEAGQRGGDHLAYINTKPRLEITFRDGWWWVTPANNQWYSFDVAITDNLRDLVYTDSIRWLCVGVNYRTDNKTGRRTVTASFELETQGRSSQVLVSLIPSVAVLDLPVMPVMPDYPFFPPNPNINAFDDNGFDFPINGDDLSNLQPFPTPAFPPVGQSGCRTISFSAQKTTNTGSGFTLQNTELYTITIKGDTEVSGDSWYIEYDFTAGQQGWAIVKNVAGDDTAVYTGGIGFTRVFDVAGQGRSETRAYLDIGNFTVTTVQVDYNTSAGADNLAVRYQTAAEVGSSEGNTAQNAFSGTAASGDNTLEVNLTFATQGRIRVDLNQEGADVTLTFRRARLFGVGTPPTGATVFAAQRADAFYYNYQNNDGEALLLPGGSGVLQDNFNISVPQPYNPNHEYTYEHTGVGLPIAFRFVGLSGETPSNTPFFVTICGAGAGSVTT